MSASNETLLEEGYIKVKRCREGTFLYNKNDKYIGKSLDVYGEYVNGETEIFRKCVAPGMVALDIGANIGVHTVALAKFVTLAGIVVAFEPQRIAHQMLCSNISLNSLKNVEAMRMALGDKEGEINVLGLDPDMVNNFGGLQLKEDGGGEPVPLRTLDSLGLGECHFMKIDVEEMEQQVIEGARDTIKRCSPIIYTENNGGDKSESLIDCINSLDYTAYWHRPMLYNADNYFGVKEDLFPHIASYNMLCFPKSFNAKIAGLVEATKENATSPYKNIIPIN